jgi:hypothetical protein
VAFEQDGTGSGEGWHGALKMRSRDSDDSDKRRMVNEFYEALKKQRGSAEHKRIEDIFNSLSSGSQEEPPKRKRKSALSVCAIQ